MTELAARSGIVTALALAAQGGAPEWIMVFPPGPDLNAVDGRSWRMDDPAAVIAASLAAGLDLPIDWEHAQDEVAPKGGRADAAGWISALELRDGVIWARVDWTPAGKASVEGKSYRYLSPSFLHLKSEPRQVTRVIGAALVNRPAFAMPALASSHPQQTEESLVDKDLLDALGLAGNATKADAITAIGKLKGDFAAATAAAQTPPVDKFMPRADYDRVLERATAAETKLAERDATELEARVTALVEGGIKEGKIAPASKDHFLALARKDLASVESLLKAAPVVVKPSDIDQRDKPATGALTDEEKAICAQMGLPEKDFIAARG
jgi:phage I-like protein